MACGKTLLLDILSKNNSKYKGTIEFESEDFKCINKRSYDSDVMYVRQCFKAPYFKTVKSYISSTINYYKTQRNSDKIINDIKLAMT